METYILEVKEVESDIEGCNVMVSLTRKKDFRPAKKCGAFFADTESEAKRNLWTHLENEGWTKAHIYELVTTNEVRKPMASSQGR